MEPKLQVAVFFLGTLLKVASSYDGGGTDPCQDKNGIIPNPEDCESYFICNNGTSDFIRCSDGLLFNKLKLTCDYDTSVDCDAEVPGNGTSLNRLSVPSDDVKCETDTCTCIYPSSTSCSEYYRCENGIAYKENCPGDLLLNRKKLTCDYAENVECEISTNPSTEDASSTDLTDPATVSNINTYGSTATSLKPTSSSPIEQNTVLSTSSKDSNNEEISYLTESTSETNDAATQTQPLPVESTVPTKDSNPEPGLSTETSDFPPVTTSSSNPFTSTETETVQLTESPSSVSIDTTVNNLSSEKPHTSELITESTSDSVETSKYSSSLKENVATESSVASQSTKQTEDTIADVTNVSQSVKTTLPDSTDFHSTTNPSIFTTISTVLSTLFVSTEDTVTEIETSTDLPTSRKNTIETESPTESPVTSKETVVADVSTDLFSTEKEPLVTETSEEFKTEKETLATEVFTDSPTTEEEIITSETSAISYTTRETPVTETRTDKKSTNEIKTDVYTTSNIAKDASEITAEPFVSDNTELTKEHTEGSVQTTKYDVSISPTTIKTPSSKIPTTVNIASTENTSVPDTTIQITEAEKSTKTHISTTLGTSRTEPETTEDSRERRSTTVLTTQERITTTQTSSKEPINTLQTTTKGKSTTVEYATDIGSTTGFTAERNASSDTTDDLPTQGETGTTGQVPTIKEFTTELKTTEESTTKTQATENDKTTEETYSKGEPTELTTEIQTTTKQLITLVQSTEEGARTSFETSQEITKVQTGSQEPTTRVVSGSDVPATSGMTGSEGPTTRVVTGSEEPTTSGVTGSEVPTTSGVTGSEEPTTSGVTGSERLTTRVVTGLDGSTTSGVTGSEEQEVTTEDQFTVTDSTTPLHSTETHESTMAAHISTEDITEKTLSTFVQTTETKQFTSDQTAEELNTEQTTAEKSTEIVSNTTYEKSTPSETTQELTTKVLPVTRVPIISDSTPELNTPKFQTSTEEVTTEIQTEGNEYITEKSTNVEERTTKIFTNAEFPSKTTQTEGGTSIPTTSGEFPTKTETISVPTSNLYTTEQEIQTTVLTTKSRTLPDEHTTVSRTTRHEPTTTTHETDEFISTITLTTGDPATVETTGTKRSTEYTSKGEEPTTIKTTLSESSTTIRTTEQNTVNDQSTETQPRTSTTETGTSKELSNETFTTEDESSTFIQTTARKPVTKTSITTTESTTKMQVSEKSTTQDHKDEPEISTQTTEKHISSTMKLTTEVQTEDPTAKVSFTSYKTTEGKSSITDQTTKEASTSTDHTMEPELSTSVGTTLKELTSETFSTPVESSTKEHDDQFDSTVETSGTITNVETTTKHTTASQITKMIPTTKSTASSTSEKTSEVESSTTHSTRSKEPTTKVFLTTVESTTGSDETDRYIETSKDDTTKSQTTTTEHNIETERTTVEPPSNVSLTSFGSTKGESSPSEQTTESKSSPSVGSTKNDESTTTYITSSPYDLSTEIVTDSDSMLDSSSVKYSTSSVITPINYSSSNTETFDSTTEIADISSVKPTEPPSVPSEFDIASTSHADFTSSNSSTVSSVFTSVETDLTESSSVTMPLYVSTEDSYDTPSHIIVSTVVPGTSCDCEDCGVQNFADCTRYLKCENGRYTSKQCEAGFLFSSESGRCENADEVEDCDQKSEQCSKEDGFFADEDDCSSFVQCYHGIAYRKFCSKDLFYNPVKRACDTEIKCGAEPILPTSRNLEVDCDCEHCIVGDSEDCSKYYICLNGVAYEETCSKTLVFNPDTGTCDYEYRTTCSSRSPQCTVMNGNLPVPGNCSLYYHCIAGVSYDKQCKPGYHFSVNSGKCEKACEAGCDPTLECPVTILPICLDPSDLLPNRNDCHTFYECSEGFPKLAQCVGDEHFNPVENICQDPCEALCDPTIDCSFTSTDDVDSTEITVPISDSSVITGATKLTSIEVSSSSTNEGTSLDDSTSSTLDHSSTESDATASEIYLSSTSSTDEFEFSTPPSYSPETSISDESSSSTESGTVSSTVDLTSSSTITNQTLTSSSLSDSTTETLISTTQESLCVEPNGVYPNPDDCRSLLLCVSGLPMKLYCEEHLHFSPITKHCEFPCNAKCDPSLDCSTTEEPDLTPLPLTFCPTKDIIPKRKSCEYYYDCTTGRRNKEKCPSGLHFNPTKRVCDVPQNADCGEPTKPLPVPDLYYKCPCESCIISSFYNCLDYFLCLNRTAYRMRCSDGLLFDRKLNTCNFAHNVVCEEPTTMRPSTTTESYTTTNEPYTTRKSHTTSTPYTASKPYTTTNNPYTTRKPYTTTSSPYTTKNPYTTRRPYTTTSTPSTTHRPYTTTRKPYVTTTTRQPYSTTRKPYVTTTTRQPYTTTRKPYESTTRKPYTTTTNKPYTTVKPTSPPKEYLCPKAIGLFRSDHNCSNFIQCSNWVPYLQHCPEGLHFNFEKQVCDYPCDAKCDKNLPCVSSTVPPPRPTPDPVCPCSNCLRPSKESCTKYYECQNGKPIKRVCLRGQTFDTTKYRCDWAHRSNCQHSEICPERNGVFPYKGDCQKFIHCANGIPHSRVCPPRLRFNPATLRCERFNGKCDAEKAPGAEKSSPQKPRFICPRNFGYFKHESNCSQFYICIKGAPLLKECPGSLLFNTKYGTCDWPENVNCRVDQSRFQKRCRYFDSRIRCPQDRAYRTHTSHCDMYYDCRTGRACTRRCPMGLYFNEKIYTCDVPSNVQCKKRDEHLYDLKELVEVCLHVHDAKMEDPGNEACYYKCHNRKVVRECCAKNRVFRMQTRRCEWKHTKMPFEFPLII